MIVEQVVPAAAQVELEQVLVDLTSLAVPMRPFSEEVIQFCADFSTRLFRDRDALRYPELQALAFWMRKAELTRLAQDFASLKKAGAVLVPRGLVFHIPPANVDTIFVYSWLVSVLTGNRNIIRLSPRASEQTAIICRLFNDALSGAPDYLKQNTVMLRYGHERDITAAISAAVDVRILWGGDASVTAIRSIPVPPRAKELTFPDRYSFAVIRASAYSSADAATRERLAGDFFNDVFWFDQMACSSPRLLVWVGKDDETTVASSDLMERVRARAVTKGYEVQPQIRLNRFAFACRAVIDGNVIRYRDLEQLVVLNIERLDQLSREHTGGGLLYETRIDELSEMSSFVIRRDQTMTYFGLGTTELEDLTLRLHGVDRMIPIGQALNFNRFWDGYDLFQELTRHVSIG